MLFRVSPVSNRSFKLMVMEVKSGSDGLESAWGVGVGAGGFACAISSADEKDAVFGEPSAFCSAGPGMLGDSSGGGSPEPDAEGGGAGCALATSVTSAIRRRVTIT